MTNFLTTAGNYFKTFFKSRSVGYWLFVCAAILAAVGSGVYYGMYRDISLLRYYTPGPAIIPLAVSLTALVLSLIRPLSGWMPAALFVAEFYSLCMYIDGSYMYLSSIFYGGVTADAIASISIGFILPIVFFLIVSVLSAVAMFMRSEKKDKLLVALVNEDIEA